MISDEELECMASTEAQNSTVAVVRTVAEMAQELLAYREAERFIWEKAPEWANWYARDAGWFFQRKPKPGDNGEWEHSEGLIEPANHDGWKSTLQGRSK